MKKIVSILLLLCMVVTLGISFTSCDMETVTPYTQLRDHLKAQLKPGQSMDIANASANIVVHLLPETTEGEGDPVMVKAEFPMGDGYKGYISFQIQNDTTQYRVEYVVLETATKKAYHSAIVELKATDYTGNDMIAFDSVTNIPVNEESARRRDVTAIFNITLTMLDTYLKDINLSVTDFGFVNLADRYLVADKNSDEIEEDLGGIFSAERWAYSGKMLVLGVGMVFFVLAILWGVLIIFSKTMGGAEKPVKAEKPAKVETKPEPQSAPTTAPAPTAANADDAIVAAITAAIAMTINSDPALSSQFAGGFRVVSFKKKNGKTSWNH